MEHILIVSLLWWTDCSVFRQTFLQAFLSSEQIFVRASKRRVLIRQRSFVLPLSGEFLRCRQLAAIKIRLHQSER